jgi:protocatechuate 4,5-dioxygenase alpha chain
MTDDAARQPAGAALGRGDGRVPPGGGFALGQGEAPEPDQNGSQKGGRAMTQTGRIDGTTIFDGGQAAKGYQLNKMCYSFNDPENRKAFLADQSSYIDKYRLTAAQREAVASGSVLKMIEAGGNAYYLAKLAGLLGLSVQDIGAQQTGMSVDAFKQKLLDAGRG